MLTNPIIKQRVYSFQIYHKNLILTIKNSPLKTASVSNFKIPKLLLVFKKIMFSEILGKKCKKYAISTKNIFIYLFAFFNPKNTSFIKFWNIQLCSCTSCLFHMFINYFYVHLVMSLEIRPLAALYPRASPRPYKKCAL